MERSQLYAVFDVDLCANVVASFLNPRGVVAIVTALCYKSDMRRTAILGWLQLAIPDVGLAIEEEIPEDYRVSLFQGIKKLSDDEAHDVMQWTAEFDRVDLLQDLRKRWVVTLEHARSADNYTLRSACGEGHLTFLRELRQWGLTVEEARVDDCFPLRIACYEGFTDIVKELRAWGLTVDDARRNNQEALRFACDEGYLDIVKELRAWGLTAEDAHESEVMSELCARDYLGIVQELRLWGLTAAHVREDGCEPLWRACNNGHLGVVQELRSWGSDGRGCP